ncbi:MAG: hypothetical protein ACO3Z6_15775 [Pseudomonadales bacterium]
MTILFIGEGLIDLAAARLADRCSRYVILWESTGGLPGQRLNLR